MIRGEVFYIYWLLGFRIDVTPSLLPREAMRKHGFCCRRCLSLRPSVGLSVTFVYCIQTAKDIVKLLSRPDSPIFLVF